jgi:hypothetical protein
VLQFRLNLDGTEESGRVPVEEAKQRIIYERKKPVPRESRAEHFKDVPVMETVELIPEKVKADPEAWVRIGEEETFVPRSQKATTLASEAPHSN